MKIRHKNTGVQLNVLLPRVFPFSTKDCPPYYQTEGGSYIAHHDYEWERVEDDRVFDNITNRYRRYFNGDVIRLVSGDKFSYKESGHNGPCILILRGRVVE